MRKSVVFSVLGVALAVAGAGSMNASTIYSGSITPTNQEGDIYFVYSATGPDGPVSGAISLGNDPLPGIAVPFTKTIPGYITSGFATVLGIYSPTLMPTSVKGPQISEATPTVSVIVNSGEAATDTGMSWDSVFTNGPDEATIESDLSTGNMSDLISFLTGNSSHFLSYSDMTTGDSGTILNFSNASIGGSATLNVASTPDITSAPEPASAWLLLGGVGLLGLKKMKRA